MRLVVNYFYFILLSSFELCSALRLSIDSVQEESLDDVTTPPKHNIIAIDCGMLYGPPNTLLAAKRALSYGANALNIDLVMTKDKKLVGMHSASHYLPYDDFEPAPAMFSSLNFDSLPRTPSCATFRTYLQSKGVEEMDLKGFGDCEPQTPTLVEEFLRAFPDTPLHFDLKGDTAEMQLQQQSILTDLIHSKFPERAKVNDGSFTSIRFFSKPGESIQLHERLKEFSKSKPKQLSLPVFLGDPSGQESYISLPSFSGNDDLELTQEDLDRDVDFREVLAVIARGPQHAPSQVHGVYLPFMMLQQHGIEVPKTWRNEFHVICDLPDIQSRASWEDCAKLGFSESHSHFFAGAQKVMPVRSTAQFLQSLASSPVQWQPAFTLRGRLNVGNHEDVTFTRCAGKQITSMLVLLLQQKGLLVGLDEPIVPHLQLTELQWKGNPVLEKLTLRQVMVGTGGLASSHVGIAKKLFQKYHYPNDVLVTQALSLIPKDHTTKNWIYSNVAWAVVERAVEVSTKQTFNQAARTHLFDPIGISDKTYYCEKGNCCSFAGALSEVLSTQHYTLSTQHYTQEELTRAEAVEMVNMKAGIGLCTNTKDWQIFAKTIQFGDILSTENFNELHVDQLKTHFPEVFPHVLNEFPLSGMRNWLNISMFSTDYISRGLGAYILPDNKGTMAWGGTWYWNNYDAAILSKPGKFYLSELTYPKLRVGGRDRACLKSSLGLEDDAQLALNEKCYLKSTR